MSGDEWKYDGYGEVLTPGLARKLSAERARVLVFCSEEERPTECFIGETSPDGDFTKLMQGGGFMGVNTVWLATSDIRILCRLPMPEERKKAAPPAYIKATYEDSGSGGL